MIAEKNRLLNSSLAHLFWFFFIALLITTVCAFIAGHQLNFPTTGIDDANIYFVYAKNFSQGQGFVYNIGGEHVEGFSSVVWTLLLSIVFSITTQPELASIALNIILVAFSIAILLWSVEHFIDDNVEVKAKYKSSLLIFCSILLFFWIFSTPEYITWSVFSLMETALWSFLLVLGTATTLHSLKAKTWRKNTVLLSCLMPLILLSRPEGMFWGMIFITAYALATLTKTKNKLKTVYRTAIPLATFISSLGAITVFRILYFGYPLPNTYYAKISPDIFYTLQGGMQYLTEFIQTHLLILPFFCVVALGIVVGLPTLRDSWMNKNTHPQNDNSKVSLLLLSVICTGGIIIPVFIGGDFFPLSRFYQPTLPLFILPSLFFLVLIQWPRRQSVALVALLIALPIFYFTTSTHWYNTNDLREMTLEFDVADYKRTVGEVLNSLFTEEPYPTIGAIAAGGIKYTYHGDVTDLLGLNNTAFGHSEGDRKGIRNHAAFNKDVFYRIQPDIVNVYIQNTTQLWKSIETQTPPISPVDPLLLQNIFIDEQFLSLYTPVFIETTYLDTTLFGYVHNDMIDTLQKNFTLHRLYQ